MEEILRKVENELEKLGFTIDELVENDHILEACTAKVAIINNLDEEGIDFEELEEKVFPNFGFVNQLIQHLDDGGEGEEFVEEFLINATQYSPRLRLLMYGE